MIDKIAAIIPYEKSKNTGPPEIKKKMNKNGRKKRINLNYENQTNHIP